MTGSARAARIGVVSDTHGLLRPEVATVLAGVDGIVHAGDIDRLEILDRLALIAPLLGAVRGNVDHGDWAAALPETAVVEVAGRHLYLLHDIGQLDLDPVAAGFDAVIYGHSHRPAIERRDGVLFLNPGSAGPRRFRLPVTLAILAVGPRGLQAELVPLLPSAPGEESG